MSVALKRRRRASLMARRRRFSAVLNRQLHGEMRRERSYPYVIFLRTDHAYSKPKLALPQKARCHPSRPARKRAG